MRVKVLGVILLILALVLCANPIAVADDFQPWCYDFNEDGIVQKSEALVAVRDYYDGIITKPHVLWVIATYYGQG